MNYLSLLLAVLGPFVVMRGNYFSVVAVSRAYSLVALAHCHVFFCCRALVVLGARASVVLGLAGFRSQAQRWHRLNCSTHVNLPDQGSTHALHWQVGFFSPLNHQYVLLSCLPVVPDSLGPHEPVEPPDPCP